MLVTTVYLMHLMQLTQDILLMCLWNHFRLLLQTIMSTAKVILQKLRAYFPEQLAHEKDD